MPTAHPCFEAKGLPRPRDAGTSAAPPEQPARERGSAAARQAMSIA
jgi:hypothetical protein